MYHQIFGSARLHLWLVAWGLIVGPAVGEVAIDRLELIAVTDTGAVLTWETNEPADGAVLFGTQSDRLDGRAVERGQPRRFHCCQVTGLKPGTPYHYICQSGSAKTSIGSLSTGQFTTLTPPPGDELFSFVQLTDTHVGETVTARLVVGNSKVVSEGVSWREPGISSWSLVLNACVDQVNALNPAFTIIKGDVTHGTGPEEFPAAKAALSRLTHPWYVARGNHDRLEPLLRTFSLKHSWYSFDHKGFHFVLIDTEPLEPAADPQRDVELDWLANDLREHRKQWTFIFTHRPIRPRINNAPSGAVTNGLFDLGRNMLQKNYGASTATRLLDTATGRRPVIHPDNARRVAELVRKHGRVAGFFAGHVHRNHVGFWPEETGNIPYVETSSTKEYPCGYAVTRVFSGGYMQSYFPIADARCVEWSYMTRDAYVRFGLGIKEGELNDRNFVVRFEKLDPTPKPGADNK